MPLPLPQRAQIGEANILLHNVLKGKIQRVAELRARGKDLQEELASSKDFTRDITGEQGLLVQDCNIDSLATEKRSINPI